MHSQSALEATVLETVLEAMLEDALFAGVPSCTLYVCILRCYDLSSS